jgi:autotransporter-associated beta strand protein
LEFFPAGPPSRMNYRRASMAHTFFAESRRNGMRLKALFEKLKTISAAGLLTASFVVTPSAQAANWTGGTGNWSSTAALNGWNGTAPNGVGAVANSAVTNSSITQDISAGVTVGTISLNTSGNTALALTLTNGITLDQDGSGSGTATILNANTNLTGTANNINITGASSLTLADNLLISNTAFSNRSLANGGAISISSAIAGTGNITIDNVLNDTSTGVGCIRLGGTSTFAGNVNVRSGLTAFTTNSAFGNAANVITLGASGAGSASLLANATVTTTNNWVVAAGSGGTLILGSFNTSGVTLSGTGTLNGDLTLLTASSSSNKFKLDGVISGVGKFTMSSGGGSGYAEMSKANTYSGSTTVSSGILSLTNALALHNSAVDTTASVTGTATAGLRIATGTTLTLGGLTGNKNLADVFATGTGASAGRYSTVTALTLNPGTGVTHTYSGAITNGAAGMTLTKTGLGTQILGGTNTYTGATSVQAGVLLVDGSTAAGSAVTVDSNAVFGGKGTVNDNLTLSNGALFAFDPGDTLDLVGSFALDSSFGVASLRNTSGTAVDWANVAQGTYTLMNTSFSFNTGNISNFGQANQATGLAGGKSAYFQQGSPTSSLQLVVVPEPGMLALAGLGMGVATLSFMKCRRRA